MACLDAPLRYINIIFLWLIVHKSILTKDVLIHRGWKGDSKCQICVLDESIDHLFLHCPLARFLWGITKCAFDLPALPGSFPDIWASWIYLFAGKTRKMVMVGVAGLFWALWNTRNEACFRNVRLLSPIGAVKRFCYCLNLWSILQTKVGNRDLLQWGTRLIEVVAKEVFTMARGWHPACCRLTVGINS